MDQDFKVKSLAKAIQVLECFSVENPELGVTEIAKMLNLQKSTVHNIISTFTEYGYIAQNPATGKYHLGLACLHFSYIINNHLGLRQIFMPYLSKISSEVNEICYLGIPCEDSVLYLDSSMPAGIGYNRNILGEKAPMYCTGLGKAMLAHLPKDMVEEYISRPLKKYTEYTIVDPKVLRDELEEIRRNGYAVDNMEHEYGIRCVAVPVFGNDNRLVAAVSVSAPSLRFDMGTISRNAQILNEILKPIQRRI